MRKLVAMSAIAVLALAACSQTTAPPQATGSASTDPCKNPPLKTAGTLTAGSSYPYYAPFKKGPKDGPEGFEPDLVQEIASRLRISQVKWVNAPFESLYAPGTKPYDFAMDQISITDERKQVVDFSAPYYLIQQGLLVRKGTPIADATSIADLKQYKFGAQTGTTGLDYIKNVIQPSAQPNEYNDTNDAAQALSVSQIDAVVIDVPIAIPLTSQYPGTAVTGQFLTNEGYGMTFEKGSALVQCVDVALAAMDGDGTLKRIQDQWLPELNVDIPVLK